MELTHLVEGEVHDGANESRASGCAEPSPFQPVPTAKTKKRGGNMISASSVRFMLTLTLYAGAVLTP